VLIELRSVRRVHGQFPLGFLMSRGAVYDGCSEARRRTGAQSDAALRPATRRAGSGEKRKSGLNCLGAHSFRLSSRPSRLVSDRARRRFRGRREGRKSVNLRHLFHLSLCPQRVEIVHHELFPEGETRKKERAAAATLTSFVLEA